MAVRIIIFMVLLIANTVELHAQYFENREQARKYNDCIELVKEDHEEALAVSRKWYIEGGGVAAQHCEALAVYEMQNFEDAAALFEQIASKVAKGEGVSEFAEKNKKVLALQLNYLAGVAWRTAGHLDRSYNALSASLAELGENSVYAYGVYLERGLVQFSLEDYDSAVADFTSALDINAEKIDAFLYRAESFRKLKEHIKARLDLNAALAIEPNQPDLLFESGVNYRMQRNDEKALSEWEKLIAKYPDTHWQKLAEDNIKLIGQ